MNPLRLTFALLAAACAFAAHAHGPLHPRDVRSEPDLAADRQAPAAQAQAQELTLSLIRRVDALRLAQPGLKVASHAALLDAARERQAVLATLAAVDPAEVLRVALPAHAREALPGEVRELVEESVDAAGELEVLHVDHADAVDDYYVHTLATAKGRYTLHFAGVAPDAPSGSHARVRGVRVGESIVVEGHAGIAVDKAAAVPNTKGAQRTLAILVNFSNAPTQRPYAVAQVHDLLFGTTSAFDHEASYQQTTLVGDVAGWFTIAATSGTCDVNGIAQQAQAAALAAGYAVASYARLVYVFPANACSWWGVGTVGGAPSQAWINTRWGLTHRVLAHELGHNLGLYHAHSLDCGYSSLSSSGCSASEYGDVFDVMGNNTGGGHYSAYQKERLGWLDDGVSPPITTVPAIAGTASYDIAPLEDARNGVPRALKIPRVSACGVATEWLYVEARQARGFDGFLSGNNNVLGGVLVHKVTQGDPDSAFLLDMTPLTAAWNDAALKPGSSFTDPMSGVRITPLSVGSAGARISVTFPPGGCTRAAPSLTLVPGGTVWTPGGASVAYTVQTQNRDGCGCAPTAFDVAASVPSGWGATSSRTTSVAPGGTTATAIVVTPSQAASIAFHPLTITAKNVGAPTLVASAAATVAIESSAATPPPPPPAPPVAGPLTASASAGSSSYRRPRYGSVSATIITTVQSAGVPVAGATVVVEVRDPRGRTSTLRGTTGSSGSVSLSHAINQDSQQGAYSATSRATSGSSSASATATFSVY